MKVNRNTPAWIAGLCIWVAFVWGMSSPRAGAREDFQGLRKQLLRAKKASTRAQAAVAIGNRFRGRAVSVALLQALKDPNIGVRRSAIHGLTRVRGIFKKDAPALLKALKDKDKQLRIGAAIVFGSMRFPSNAVASALGSALTRDSAWEVRAEAAASLGRIWPTITGSPSFIKGLKAKLAKAIDDKRRGVRREAERALLKMGKFAIPALVASLKGSGDNTRATHVLLLLSRRFWYGKKLKGKHAEALRTLGSSGKSFIALALAAIANNDCKSRELLSTVAVVGTLGKVALPALRGLLRHKQKSTRECAAIGLGHVGAVSVPDLRKLLQKHRAQSHVYCWSVTTALGLSGPKASPAIPELMELLKAKDRACRSRVMQTFGEIGAKASSAIPALLQATIAPRSYIDRDSALKALAKIGPSSIPALLGLLKHKDPKVRAAAPLGLRLMGAQAKPAVPALLRAALHDKAHKVRQRSLWALGYIKPKPGRVVPTLLKVLKDNSSLVRGQALLTLGDLKPKAKRILPALLKALDDSSHRVQRAALTVLAGLGHKSHPALPLLLKKFRANKKLRKPLAKALGRIGPKASPAIPLLIAEAKTSSWYFDLKIYAKALRNIGPKALLALKKSFEDPSAKARLQLMKVLDLWNSSAWFKPPVYRYKGLTKLQLPLLKKGLKDPDQGVRKQAHKALKSLCRRKRKSLASLRALCKRGR